MGAVDGRGVPLVLVGTVPVTVEPITVEPVTVGAVVVELVGRERVTGVEPVTRSDAREVTREVTADGVATSSGGGRRPPLRSESPPSGRVQRGTSRVVAVNITYAHNWRWWKLNIDSSV